MSPIRDSLKASQYWSDKRLARQTRSHGNLCLGIDATDRLTSLLTRKLIYQSMYCRYYTQVTHKYVERERQEVLGVGVGMLGCW